MSEQKYCLYCGTKTDGQDFCGEFCQLEHEMALAGKSEDIHLTVKEIEYLIKACRSLPAKEKDNEIIRSLTLKFTKHMRLARIGEMFGV